MVLFGVMGVCFDRFTLVTASSLGGMLAVMIGVSVWSTGLDIDQFACSPSWMPLSFLVFALVAFLTQHAPMVHCAAGVSYYTHVEFGEDVKYVFLRIQEAIEDDFTSHTSTVPSITLDRAGTCVVLKLLCSWASYLIECCAEIAVLLGQLSH